MTNRAGQFAAKNSWKGVLHHEDGRTARGGEKAGKIAQAVCVLVWARGKSTAFLGLYAGIAFGGRPEERGAYGLGVWRA